MWPLFMLIAALAAGALAEQTPRLGLADRTTAVAGRVVDGVTRRPVAGAAVCVFPPGTAGAPCELALLTDANGRFEVRDVPPGEYGIWAAKSGRKGAYGQRHFDGRPSSINVVARTAIAGLEVPIWPYAEISGVVSDEHRHPIPYALVRAVSYASLANPFSPPPIFEARTDDTGRFVIDGLPPDRYLIVVPASPRPGPLPEWPSAPSPFDFEPDIVRGLSPPRPSRDGRNVAYVTTFAPSATSPLAAQVVDVTTGSDIGGVDVQMQSSLSATVAGQIVTLKGDGIGFLVSLVTSADIAALQTPYASTFTDDGRFWFDEVPDGQYQLRFDRVFGGVSHGYGDDPAGMSAVRAITMAGRDVRDLRIELSPGFRVRGRVAVANAQVALPSIDVELRSIDPGAPDGLRLIRADSNGDLTWTGIPPGRYLPIVYVESTALAITEVAVAGRRLVAQPIEVLKDLDRLMFTFDTPGIVKGTVLDRDGRAPDAAVFLFPADRELWPHSGLPGLLVDQISPLARQIPDEKGFFTAVVAPGEYFLVAVATGPDIWRWPMPDYLEQLITRAARIHVAAGQTSTNRLRLD